MMGIEVEGNKDVDIDIEICGIDETGTKRLKQNVEMCCVMTNYSYKSQWREWSSLKRRNSELFNHSMFERKDFV